MQSVSPEANAYRVQVQEHFNVIAIDSSSVSTPCSAPVYNPLRNESKGWLTSSLGSVRSRAPAWMAPKHKLCYVHLLSFTYSRLHPHTPRCACATNNSQSKEGTCNQYSTAPIYKQGGLYRASQAGTPAARHARRGRLNIRSTGSKTARLPTAQATFLLPEKAMAEATKSMPTSICMRPSGPYPRIKLKVLLPRGSSGAEGAGRSLGGPRLLLRKPWPRECCCCVRVARSTRGWKYHC